MGSSPERCSQIKLGEIQLEICTGRMTLSDADTIVNSTDESMNFSRGLSRDIAVKAGLDLEKACTGFIPLAVGSVVETDGYGSQFKQILHCNCHVWRDGKNIKELPKIMLACLEKCGEDQHQSIALPLLGKANGFPSKIVAKSIVAAIREFGRSYAKSTLTQVQMCIENDGDTGALKEMFENFFEELRKGEKTVKVGLLEVCRGDLALTKATLIVNSTGGNMFLSNASASSALLNKAGKELQEECYRRGSLSHGEIVVTKGYGLLCHKVLHICLRFWNKQTSEKALLETILKCLDWAEAFSASSIAFPAVGTGNLCYPADAVAQCFQSAVSQFEASNPCSHLSNVTVVVFHKNDKAKQGFEKVFGAKLPTLAEMRAREFSPMSANANSKTVFDLPDHWSSPHNVYKEVTVQTGTHEWNTVVTEFNRTKSPEHSVTFVEIIRIQNPERYTIYDARRKGVAQRLNKPEKEVEKVPLWHGTRPESAPYIARTKFDRGFSNPDGRRVYGAGSYFAVTSKYSSRDSFCRPDGDGVKFMFLARVVCGDFCLGKQEHRTAPYKPKPSLDQYDSVVDNVDNPELYAVFDDASAYPDYLIKFKLVTTA